VPDYVLVKLTFKQSHVDAAIARLLEEAETVDPDSSEFRSWSSDSICALSIAPLVALDIFEVERFDYPTGTGHEFRLRPRVTVEDELLSLVQHAWRATGGCDTPEQGFHALVVASTELVRAQLHIALWMAGRLKYYREVDSAFSERFIELVAQVDWLDAATVVRRPWQVLSGLGVNESIADNLYNWTAYLDREGNNPAFQRRAPANQSSQVVTQQALLAGAALLWIDAALASSQMDIALGLMAGASNAMWQAGFTSGWEGRDEMLRTDARHAGTRGGRVRHKATGELKLWALQEAATMRGSDMDVARNLAKRLPTHLQGASIDAERLIYDALRTAAAARRSTGDSG